MVDRDLLDGHNVLNLFKRVIEGNPVRLINFD